jgi:hypothetical protein
VACRQSRTIGRPVMAGAPALLCGLAADAEAGGDVGPGAARPRLAGSVIAPAVPALSARHGRMSKAPSWSVAAQGRWGLARARPGLPQGRRPVLAPGPRGQKIVARMYWGRMVNLYDSGCERSQVDRGFNAQPPRRPNVFALGIWHWDPCTLPRSFDGSVLHLAYVLLGSSLVTGDTCAWWFGWVLRALA